MANQNDVSIYAVGDVHPMRQDPESLFALAAPILKQADILFGQLETNLTGKGDIQVRMYPGVRVDPSNVRALTSAGFHIVSHASNHTLNWGEEALIETLELLRKNGIAVAGAGRNIEEARKPVIFERKGTRVAFLAYCSVLPPGYEARADKAGAAPLRATTFYEQVDWQPGTPPRTVTFTNKEDLEAMKEDIRKAKSQADVVAVSMHWGVHNAPALLAMYQKEAGYAAIDSGADIILGHHAHILKGIEVYKGKVIFYSLGNFAFDQVSARMRDDRWAELYHYQVDPEYTTFPFAIEARKTIVAKCLISNKRIARVSFMPAWITKTGQPEVLKAADKRSSEVLEYIEWACKDQKLDTRFTREGDEVVINI